MKPIASVALLCRKDDGFRCAQPILRATEQIVADLVTSLLDTRPHFGYIRCESRSVKDAFGRGYSRKRSECGARGREDTARSRAWASCLPALRPAREVLSLDWDRPARVTPAERREVSAPRLGRAFRTKRSGQVAGNMA